MNIYQVESYVYKITCIPTNQFYYGYREKNIALQRTPVDDLWVEYFTSSVKIKSLSQQYSLDLFNIEFLFTSIDPTESYWCEQRYIKDNWGHPLLLNRHYRDPDCNYSMFRATSESSKKSAETCRSRGSKAVSTAKMIETKKQNGSFATAGVKIAKTKAIRGTSKSGAIKTAATKKLRGTDISGAAKATNTKLKNGIYDIAALKMIETKKQNGTLYTGAKKIAENKKANGTDIIGAKKIAENRRQNGTDIIGARKRAEKLAKYWEVFYLNEPAIIIHNLNKFCRDRNLDASTLSGTAKKNNSHKGWKCIETTKECYLIYLDKSGGE